MRKILFLFNITSWIFILGFVFFKFLPDRSLVLAQYPSGCSACQGVNSWCVEDGSGYHCGGITLCPGPGGTPVICGTCGARVSGSVNCPAGCTCGRYNYVGGATSCGNDCIIVESCGATATATATATSSGGCTDGSCYSNSLASDGFINNCGEVGAAEGAGTCSGGRCCKPPAAGGCSTPDRCSISVARASAALVPENGTSTNIASGATINLTQGGSIFLDSRSTWFPTCPRTEYQDFLGFHITSSKPSAAYMLNPQRTSFYNYDKRLDPSVVNNYYRFQAIRNTSTGKRLPRIQVPPDATPGDIARITSNGVTEFIYNDNPTINCSISFNVRIVEAAKAWWQVKDGDVISGGDLVSKIPATCTGSCTPIFDLKGGGGFPGLPIYGGSDYDFSGSSTSRGTPAERTPTWIANSEYAQILESYDYAYFSKKIPADVPINTIPDKNNISTGSFVSGTVSPRGYVWFKIDGDATINGNVNFVNDEKVILLVNGGDLRISKTISVQKPGKGFFMVMVGKDANGDKGNIIIEPSVSGQPPELQGLFLADGKITTGSSGAANDPRLRVRGALVGLEGVEFQRDLGPTNNQTIPAEFIEYAPELVASFPGEFFRDKIIWEEVAP